MRILVIGGTSFVGRHYVEAALEAGHLVTLFNRGKTGADLFPDLERLTGDRTKTVDAIRGRTWDAAFDTSAYVPRVARMTAEALADSVPHYTFISSISVYSDFSNPGLDETGALQTLEDPGVEEVTGETYGGLKVLCENAVSEVYSRGALIIRPGIIAGPYDPTDRFTYLAARAARSGKMLVPGSLDSPLQFIDARDLAAWSLHAMEAGIEGIYNAVAPPITVGDVLNTAYDVAGADTKFVSIDRAFLEAHDVDPNAVNTWYLDDPDTEGNFWKVDGSKAAAVGMSFRPLIETVRDTIEWAKTRGADYTWRAGIGEEHEAELVEMIG